MPYDETVAKTYITDINTKLREISTNEQKLRAIEKSLRGIVDVLVEDEKTHTDKKIKPNDPGTGKTITDKRRDEVFDSMILEADTLLGA